MRSIKLSCNKVSFVAYMIREAEKFKGCFQPIFAKQLRSKARFAWLVIIVLVIVYFVVIYVGFNNIAQVLKEADIQRIDSEQVELRLKNYE